MVWREKKNLSKIKPNLIQTDTLVTMSELFSLSLAKQLGYQILEWDLLFFMC